MRDDEIRVETEELPAAAAAWRAGVPATVTYPEVPAGVDDVATAGVIAAIAHWPVEHTVMATHRETAASAMEAAAHATTGILSARDDDGAAQIAASQDV
jgi:hypothetical protein